MSDRREFLKSLSAAMVSPAVAGETIARLPEPAPVAHSGHRRPNVLLMICDDLGYGDLGCYGSSIPTPNLDRLAAQGVRCTHHNSAHPICSASRAALLTGRYAPRSGTPGALFPHQAGMAKDEQTLGNLFHDAGYRTHAVGKWHLGDVAGYWPTERGFDSFLGVPYSDDMQPLPLMQDLTELEHDTDRDELTPRYTEAALKALAQAGEQPFFLYLAYSYPHDPARGSKAFRGRSQFGDFGDAVQEIDWSVGQLLGSLERSGLSETTIVIFTSDHGPWFQGSPGGMRGRKGSTFEGGVRVPFLVRWPERLPRATVCSQWDNHLNVVPTLAAWCGLELPKLPHDGVDSAPALERGRPTEEKPVLYFTPVGNTAIHCVRAGDWKLRVAQSDGQIYINDRPGSKTNYWLPRPELYDLKADPAESYDVAAKHPDIVSSLLAQLERELATFPTEVQEANKDVRANVASRTTPPAAAPRPVVPHLPDWAWEPPDRR